MSKRLRGVMALAITVGVVLQIGGAFLLYGFLRQVFSGRVVREREDARQRLREVKQAFGGKPAEAGGAADGAFAALFDDLGRAFRAADGGAILAHFDLD